MQNLDVLRSEGVFLLSILLRVSNQGIGSFVSLTLTIIESGNRRVSEPSGLVWSQTLRVHESSEVVMVGKHGAFMSRALWIMPPGLESLNDG